MNLVPASVLVVVLVALAVTNAVHAVSPWLTPMLSAMEPHRRVHWLVGLLAAPSAIGVSVLVIALGHCVVPRLTGLPDDCHGLAGQGCNYCVFRVNEAGARAWVLALVCLMPLAHSLARTGVGVAKARRARRRMEAVALRNVDGVLLVPGCDALLVGWPSAAIFLGEDLSRALSREGVAAVMAHEREHQRRGDVPLRMLARTLGVLHLRWVRDRLISELDTAIEQTCDARASSVVDDPLIVAQALIATAQMHAHSRHQHGCVGASLPARISALCETQSTVPPGQSVSHAPIALALALAALLCTHQIHVLAEVVSHLISR